MSSSSNQAALQEEASLEKKNLVHENRTSPSRGKPQGMARVGSSSSRYNLAQLDRLNNRQNQHYIPVDDNIYQQGITVDDDLDFTATGRLETTLGVFLYYMLSVISGGLFYLVCRWFINVEIHIKSRSCPLKEASHVVITNQWDEVNYVRVNSMEFRGYLSEVFPAMFEGEHPHFVDRVVDTLFYFEYRYFRFILNPYSGQFEPNYAWCDPKWTSVDELLQGHSTLSSDAIRQRNALFGLNTVDIQEKSTIRLLFDEVLHPFFVFQIASIILWSIDNYYYYAACIFIISVISTVITLVSLFNVD